MKCPVDGTILDKHVISSIEVEECPQCRGIWFAEDALRRTKDEVEADLNWVDFDPWSGENNVEAKWSSRLCPVCNEKMASLQYPETNVTLEYCLKEHGIWLDAGEFEAIIGSLEARLNSTKLSDYITASIKEAREIISGREGFSSEWKDFLTVMKLLQLRFVVDHPNLATALTTLQASLPR